MPYGIGPDGKPVYIPASEQEAALRGAAEGAWESAPVRGLRSIVGGAAHALSAPFRAVSAVGQNIAGTGKPVDVSDVALYGYDVETGATPEGYGTLLRRAMVGEEQAGDAPTSWGMDKLADIVQMAGNILSDPVALAAGVGVGGSTLRAAEAGAAARNPMIARAGAARMQPQPKPRFVGEALDTDLTPAGPQNRVYSLPSRLRAWDRGVVGGPRDVLSQSRAPRLGRNPQAEARAALESEGFTGLPPEPTGTPLHDIPPPRLGARPRRRPPSGVLDRDLAGSPEFAARMRR